MQGTIIEFLSFKGFGFLKDSEKDEYCFYTQDINEQEHPLKKGDRVFFDLYKGRGTRAVNIQKEQPAV